MGEHSELAESRQDVTEKSDNPGGGSVWEGVEDLTALTVEELRDQLESLSAQEKEVSYRRRVLQGRIDLIRAEIVGRGQATLSVEELAQVLLDSQPEQKAGEERL